MTVRVDQENWRQDGVGPHKWVLDDGGNYLAELVTQDDEGRCRSGRDLAAIGELMANAPTLACFLHQALGLLALVRAHKWGRAPAHLGKTIDLLVENGTDLLDGLRSAGAKFNAVEEYNEG